LEKFAIRPLFALEDEKWVVGLLLRLLLEDVIRQDSPLHVALCRPVKIGLGGDYATTTVSQIMADVKLRVQVRYKCCCTRCAGKEWYFPVVLAVLHGVKVS
jgi:hypothetical protein